MLPDPIDMMTPTPAIEMRKPASRPPRSRSPSRGTASPMVNTGIAAPISAVVAASVKTSPRFWHAQKSATPVSPRIIGARPVAIRSPRRATIAVRMTSAIPTRALAIVSGGTWGKTALLAAADPAQITFAVMSAAIASAWRGTGGQSA